MATNRFEWKIWARWIGSFIGFPLAGLAARAVAGNIDDLGSGLAGGLAAGAVLGGVQAIALRRQITDKAAWTVATAVGLGVGLAIGATSVGFETTTAALVAMGAVSGLAVGIAQAMVMRAGAQRRVLWAASSSALWALGWWVTSMVIVDVDRQHATFGASGALLATILGGLVLGIRPEADWTAPAGVPVATDHEPVAVP